MARAIWVAAFIAGTVLIPGAATAEELRLGCDGDASKTVGRTTTGAFYNSNGDSANGSMTAYGTQTVRDHLAVEISGDRGRVQVPRSMTPPVNSGGKDGWWQLSEIKVSDSAIAATFRLNPFNHPTVRIDRTTGEIAIDGFGNGFRGQCHAIDPATRKF